MRKPVNLFRLICIALVALSLAGCGGLGSISMGDLFSSGETPEPGQPQPAPDVAAIQNPGDPKVAVLLPLGIRGGASDVARSLKEAGEMALVESGSPGITLVTKDTLGTPEGARAAAEAALNEGAELIIGPLFAGSVQAIGPVAQSRGVPVMAFSTSSSAAGNGVFLNSFLPEQDVANIVRFAVQSGQNRFAALIPETAYGGLVERSLRQELSGRGGQLVVVQRYQRTPQGAARAAGLIAASMKDPTVGADTLLIAEGGDMLRALGNALTGAGVNPQITKIIGTSLWDDPATASIDIAVGGWYPGVAPELTNAFNTRFRQSYGRDPKRIASLAYDSVSLAIALGRQNAQSPAGQKFPVSALTNSQGFQGSNGLFRFLGNGLNQRGLAILEVTKTGPRVAAPAPSTFSGGF